MFNILDDVVLNGKDDSENVEVFCWGILKIYDFEVKDYVDLGEMGDGLDFVSVIKIMGVCFVVMKG